MSQIKVIIKHLCLSLICLSCYDNNDIVKNRDYKECELCKEHISSIISNYKDESIIDNCYYPYNKDKGKKRTDLILNIHKQLMNNAELYENWNVIKFSKLPIELKKKYRDLELNKKICFVIKNNKTCFPFLLERGLIKSSIPIFKGERIYWW